jgi:hypothetical protein
MAAMSPAPTDEQPHTSPPGVGDTWSETWSFDFATADGDLGGWVRFTRFADHAWYQAALAGPRRPLITVLDHHVPFRSNPLEVRTTDLWADHVCETPFDHWTLGLEAFALGVDDPLELHGRQLGDRVPLGFDLEWESDGPVLDRSAPSGAEGYEVACRVHGEVLIGPSVLDVDAFGTRAHDWGPIDWWGDDGWHLSGVVEGDRRWWVDHRAGRTTATVVDADGAVSRSDASARLELDADGLPARVSVEAGGGTLRAEVLAQSPVPIEDGARRARRPRALCRYRTDGGAVGVGWLELRGGPGAGALEGC